MSTKDLVLVALFAALIAVLGIFPAITIPVLLVPITAQTLGVMLAGSLLGATRGGLAVLVFLILVAVGLPLLAGGRGGLGVFGGPSAGFLIAWPVAAFVIGWLTERAWTRYGLVTALGINLFGGIVLIYVPGIVWLAAGGLGFGQATALSSAFVPGDVLKAVLASLVSVTLRRYRQHPIAEKRAKA
ncbi:MAG: biotin transporter BioY [Pseudomonadota bacterium]